MRIVYALEEVQGRYGELAFLTHNQAYWSPSLKKVLKEREDSKEELMEENLPMPKIFKLTVEELSV